MSLSDRLRQARQRDGKTDDTTSEVVDLAAEESIEAPAPAPQFGFPTRCPDCGGRGYLDRVDLVDRIQYQHCLTCGHQWSLSEVDMKV